MTLNIVQIIEDEPLHAQLLDHSLRQARYRTNVAHDGVTGLADVMRLTPSLILLDLMLPGMNGQEVCRRIRSEPATKHIPIMMISALGSDEDRISGIRMGADDYLAKPFSPREVVSRAQALLRRSQAQWATAPCLSGSPVTIKDHCLLVSVFGKEFTVSPRELTLLRLFTARPGSIVASEELIGLLWDDSPLLHEHELERLVRDLNRKTADHLLGSIETFPGIGYRFTPSALD